MRKLDLQDMDFDELWLLHEELTKILADKISAEKSKLEKRLAQLSLGEQAGEAPRRNSGLTGPGANIRKFSPSTSIRPRHWKHGLVAASSRGGSSPRFGPGTVLKTSASLLPRRQAEIGVDEASAPNAHQSAGPLRHSS